MASKNVNGTYCSVYRDTSKKYDRNGNRITHNCYRAEIADWCDGKRVSRKRARFKTPSEAWAWLGQIK